MKNFILVHSYTKLHLVSLHTKMVFTKSEILYNKIHQTVFEHYKNQNTHCNTLLQHNYSPRNLILDNNSIQKFNTVKNERN